MVKRSKIWIQQVSPTKFDVNSFNFIEKYVLAANILEDVVQMIHAHTSYQWKENCDVFYLDFCLVASQPPLITLQV